MFQSFYIIQGVLTKLICSHITIKTFFPTGIVKNCRSDFVACISINYDGTYGVSTVVNSDYKFIIFHMQRIGLGVKITLILIAAKKIIIIH